MVTRLPLLFALVAAGSTLLSGARSNLDLTQSSPPLLVLGDSIHGQLIAGRSDTIAIALNEGERIDLAVYGRQSGGLRNPAVGLYGPDWKPLKGASETYLLESATGTRTAAVIGGHAIAGTGMHFIIVTGINSVAAGGYTLKARKSGALLSVWPSQASLPMLRPTHRKQIAGAFGGSIARDTVWVRNMGGAPGHWSLVSLDPRVVVSVSGGSFSALDSRTNDRADVNEHHGLLAPDASWHHKPTRPDLPLALSTVAEQPLTLPPGGAVPVEVGVILGGFQQRTTVLRDALRFMNDDGWIGPALVGVELWVHHPSTERLTDGLPYYVDGMARLPDGTIVVAASGSLHKVDLVTRTRSHWVTVGAGGQGNLWGLTAASDGTVYVADGSRNSIWRVSLSGVVTEFVSGIDRPYTVAVAAAGDVYVVGYFDGLYRISPGGAKALVAAIPGLTHTAVAYDALTEAVYFATETRGPLGPIPPYHIYRYQPGTTEASFIAEVQRPVIDLERAASGQWYLKHFDGIGHYDSDFRELRYFHGLPGGGNALTIVPGAVLGNTNGFPENPRIGPFGEIYGIPIADGPMSHALSLLTVTGVAEVAVPPGGRASTVIRVAAPSNSEIPVAVTWKAQWLDASPTSTWTPGEVVLHFDAAGLARGFYHDTLVITPESPSLAPQRIVVRLEVLPNLLALGDSVIGAGSGFGHIDTLFLDLMAGQRIDIALSGRLPQPLALSHLTVTEPQFGATVALRYSAYNDGFEYRGPNGIERLIVPNFVAPKSGRYLLLITTICDQCGTWAHRYVLKVRQSGALIGIAPSNRFLKLSGPTGGLASGTITLHNRGAEPGSWTATSLDPRVSVRPTAGSLQQEPAALVAGSTFFGVGRGSAPTETARLGPRSTQYLSDTRSPPNVSYPHHPGGTVAVEFAVGTLGPGTHWVGTAFELDTDDGWFGPVVLGVEVTVNLAVPVRAGRITAEQADTVDLPVSLDMSATGAAVGSFEISFEVDTSVARVLSVRPGSFAGAFQVASVGTGRWTLTGMNSVPGVNRDTMSVGIVRLLVVGQHGDTAVVTPEISSLRTTSLADITHLAHPLQGWIAVHAPLWGDPNMDDMISVADAIICLRQAVGLNATEFRTALCDVVPDSDEGFSGTVSALDALAILSHVVGKPLPVAYRVGKRK